MLSGFDEPPEGYDPDAVHLSHCCAIHGCKYCEDDCPVATHRKPQLYACEDCSEEARSFHEDEREKFALRQEIARLKLENRALTQALLQSMPNK